MSKARSRVCTVARRVSCNAAALFLLPESPRWLVVNGRLDEALTVIQHILTGSTLPNGASLPVSILTSSWHACESGLRADGYARKGFAHNSGTTCRNLTNDCRQQGQHCRC
jgi:hypothetical protein